MTIDMLKRSVTGEVIAAADSAFEATRTSLIWNGRKPDRRPAVIVRAANAADVEAAVRYAAANGMKVSARGSGHHFALLSMQEGVVVDLSRLNTIEIDAAGRTARLGPVVRNGDLAAALGAYGLAFPVGHCASVSLSGYMLGGGIGWNAGVWGLACHNLLEAEVVLADGSRIVASETSHPDVFWAVRGGGPQFFGIVTSYRVRLHELPAAIRTSVWTFPIERAAEVERWMSATMPKVPANVEFTALFSAAPPPLADRAARTVTAIATIFAGSEAEAAATRATIAAGAPAGALDVQLDMPTPFDVLYGLIGQFFPEGHRFAADTNWTADAAAGFAGLAEAVTEAPSPRSFALGVVLPPPGEAPPPDTAFSMAGPVFTCAYAAWDEPAADADNMAWLRRSNARMAPHSLGHYVGESDLEREGVIHRCYAPAAFERLEALRRRYDPAGLFHAPSGAPQPARGSSRAA